MREKSIVSAEMAEAKEKIDALETQIAQREEELKPKLDPIEKRIAEIEAEKKVVTRGGVLQNIGVWCVVIGIAFGLVNLFALHFEDITGLSIFGGIVIWGILYWLDGKIIKSRVKPIDEKLEAETKKRADILKNDTENSTLVKERRAWSDKYQGLTAEYDTICLTEAIGKNNLIVYVDYAGAVSNIHFNLSANMNIDGSSRGIVARPFSIIQLTPGIHSISFDLVIHNSDRDVYTIPETQFSVNESNKFIVVKDINRSMGLTYKLEKLDSFESFSGATGISRSTAVSYLENL